MTLVYRLQDATRIEIDMLIQYSGRPSTKLVQYNSCFNSVHALMQLATSV